MFIAQLCLMECQMFQCAHFSLLLFIAGDAHKFDEVILYVRSLKLGVMSTKRNRGFNFTHICRDGYVNCVPISNNDKTGKLNTNVTLFGLLSLYKRLYLYASELKHPNAHTKESSGKSYFMKIIIYYGKIVRKEM